MYTPSPCSLALIYNALLLLLWYLQFSSRWHLPQGVCCGESIADVERSTYLLQSISLSVWMYVSGVQGPSWFGKLQLFNAWHFWQGSQRLLKQVGGDVIM